jgi:hypothetical protein
MHGRITLCGLLLGVSPLVLADGDIPLVADGELTFVSDSNLSRGDRERDRLDDSALLASAGVALRLSPGFKSALNFRAFAEAERFETYPLVGSHIGGGAGHLSWDRHDWGYTAPYLPVECKRAER